MLEDIQVLEKRAPLIPFDSDVATSRVPRIQLIFIAIEPGSEMLFMPEVIAFAHAGLDGDRHCVRPGLKPEELIEGGVATGTVSLMAREDLNYANDLRIANGLTLILPKETRRNLISVGSDPKILVQRIIKVGSRVDAVHFYGLDELTACDRPSRLLEKKGRKKGSGHKLKTQFKRYFEGLAGVRLVPLTTGVMHKDDVIEMTDRKLRDFSQ